MDNEKCRYDLHQNSPHDQKYRVFLTRLLDHLIPHLSPDAHGLDYGSGPVPTLSELVGEKGFLVKNYDLHYANKKDLLDRQYDFLTCAETAEHFRTPEKEWITIFNLVKKGGWIGVMTELVSDRIDFASWYYKGDPTHICFYSKETFRWLANHFKMKCRFFGSSIVLMASR